MGDEKQAGTAKLSDGVGFATVKPKFSDASSQLVELMRATLRHAQEISVSVGEAEATAESVKEAIAMTDNVTTPAERRIVEAEIERLSASMFLWPDVDSKSDGDKRTQSMLPALVPTVASVAHTDASVGDASDGNSAGNVGASPSEFSADVGGSRPAISIGGSKSVASQMNKEIERTVMWVQQLLESVHFIESDKSLEPGASLLSIVQPRLRHQKDEARHRSLTLFEEKKETEKEIDEHAALFRRRALQAVASQSQHTSSREGSFRG